MKLLTTCLIIFTMGITASHAQRTFAYKIDEQTYSIDEQKLNDLYGSAFDKIVAHGATNEKYFNMWTETFSQWKTYTLGGVWNYETIGNRVSSTSFNGNIDEMFLGWDTGHKNPKGNPNNQKNWAKRIQIMNTYLSREIIYYLTRKVIIN